MKLKHFITTAAAVAALVVLIGQRTRLSDLATSSFEARVQGEKNKDIEKFKSAAVFRLLSVDPAQAEARISKLPLDQRMGVLAQADKMSEEEEIAYAEIVRRQLDEKGRVAAIAARAEKAFRSGVDFTAVDEYLNIVYAAPDERERAAENVARRYIHDLAMKNELDATKIEKMRAWAERDAPELLAQLTGEALGLAVTKGSGMDFAKASKLAQRYRESDGNDDVLYAFLSILDPIKNRTEARTLAEYIADPAKREMLLRKFE